MNLSSAKPNQTAPFFRSFFTSLPLVRYGVAAIILATISYAGLHIIPLILNDLRLLRGLSEADIRGVRLEGQLQNQIQQSRSLFLRALLADNTAADLAQRQQSLRAIDQSIAATERELSHLGILSLSKQEQFELGWQRYIVQRDVLIAKAQQGKLAAVLAFDPQLGSGLFSPVEQTLQSSADVFQDNSSRRIAIVAFSLHRVLRELWFLIALKFAALGLLFWLDWKRVHAETQLKRTARDLQRSEDRFHRAYQSASVGMGMFSLDGTVISANRRAAEILGCDIQQLIGSKVSDIMAPEFREDHLQRIASLPGSPQENYQTERRVVRQNGTYAWVRNSVTLLKPDEGEPYYFSISEEITHQKEANERLAFLANYDPITNLPNRFHFEELLATALQPVAGFLDCVALIYLEIDSFDFLKGTFGRAIADEFLGQLGANLIHFRREGEIIARLDDHVFALMVKAAPYDEGSLTRGAELRDVLHLTSEASKHRIPLAASIGIAYSNNGADGTASARGQATTPHNAQTEAENLLKYARAAMLEARSRGGDSIYLADPALQERAAQRHRIELALLRGLRENEFRVVFQPQFEVRSGKLVRFEALCRWTSAELGTIAPDRFIPIAEQTGLIMEIGRQVLYEALMQARSWADSGRRIGVAVNISPMQFMRPDFTQVIADVLVATQFPPFLLELEITEGIFIRDLNLAVARIRELQRLGISIALDDFGTGYSSLSYLQRMPINAVKLDRSFVSDLTTDQATVSMVRSVLAMAEALHLRVVTEGVETEQQLEILRALGCDEAQGYLLGRPESAAHALQRVLDSPTSSQGNVTRLVS